MEDVPMEIKDNNLKKDINNSFSHVFGEHKECQAIGYFCNEPYIAEGTVLNDLKLTGIVYFRSF